MSYYVAYSPLFTGEMTNPDFGAKITDYENFNHLCETVHDEWAFNPDIDWATANTDDYPRTQYAYLYGFTLPTHDEPSHRDPSHTWSLNKATPDTPLFRNIWKAVAMTCEPCSILMYPNSSDFPRLNTLVTRDEDPTIHRLDIERGHITHVEVNIHDYTESTVNTYDWNPDTYEDERFLGGINY